MKLLITFLTVVLLNDVNVNGQTHLEKDANLIHSFLQDLFLKKTPCKKRYKNYIVDATLKKNKREKLKFFKAFLSKLKEDNPSLTNDSILSKTKITRYNNYPFPEKLINFSNDGLDKIYVVENNNKVLYFLMENNKIKAFQHVQKGSIGPGYFVY